MTYEWVFNELVDIMSYMSIRKKLKGSTEPRGIIFLIDLSLEIKVVYQTQLKDLSVFRTYDLPLNLGGG